MTVHHKRRSRLRDALSAHSGGVFVTRDLASVRYLTGFSGSNATVVIGTDEVHLVTDGRYREQAAHESPDVVAIIDRDVVGAMRGLCTGGEIDLDDRTPVGIAQQLTEAGLTVRAVADPVAPLRMVKDAQELDALSRAGHITARALEQVADTITVGDREADVARRLEAAFAEWGAEDRAFATIVAGGENSALPHHRAGDRQLAMGDLLVIDCGAKVEGYHADMTRTFVVGAAPDEWQHEIHSLVLRAQEAARDALAPEVIAGDIDAAARELITQAGFGEAFAHGTGHGVGLDIHEQPMLSARSSAVLPEHAVVTVEPGIYLPGRGGVRIEDTVVVAHAPQVLTDLERGLTRVG